MELLSLQNRVTTTNGAVYGTKTSYFAAFWDTRGRQYLAEFWDEAERNGFAHQLQQQLMIRHG